MGKRGRNPYLPTYQLPLRRDGGDFAGASAVPVAAVGLVPLSEGSAGRNPEPGPFRKVCLPPASSRYTEPAPYARGSHKVALALASDNS
jgi:hypothetical protein